MSNQRLFALGLVGIAAFIAFVMTNLIGTILAAVGVGDIELFGGLVLHTVVGVLIGVGIGVWGWMSPRIQEVGQEIASELKKVTWPSWPEIKAATVAVVVFSVVAALILGAFDFVSSKVMIDWIPAGIRWAQGLFA